jgi:hypothetical protein
MLVQLATSRSMANLLHLQRVHVVEEAHGAAPTQALDTFLTAYNHDAGDERIFRPGWSRPPRSSRLTTTLSP